MGQSGTGLVFLIVDTILTVITSTNHSFLDTIIGVDIRAFWERLIVLCFFVIFASHVKKIEFSLIKEHARSGYEMLKDVESPWPLAEIVYQHHERMNGSGYPRNLKGDEILMESQILAVADVAEACLRLFREKGYQLS